MRDPAKRYQHISEVMEHPWFNDISWSQFSNKTVKPPLIPDITQSYFEADNGDEEDFESSFYGHSSRHGGSASKKENAQRRHSYYIHSTVFLHSQIDDRASFIRSPSQMRQLLDSSALLTNMNDSVLLQHAHSNMLDASIRLPMMQKQYSQRSGMLEKTSLATENFLSASYRELPR